jgi:nucleotide-binding universal stress UspA family protein
VVYADVGTESDQADARAYLDGIARTLHGSQVIVDVRVGRSIDTILDASRDHGCSLVCMATHAQPANLGQIIVGTVTDGVLRRGSNPLLLVRPR